MKFVETENLKTGMRLARPIYNKKGVLLFERDSRLSMQTIDSVKNFGLLGVYVLEPAEPLPPMSEEDLEFERFQIMTGFSIGEELEKMLATGKQSRMETIASMIIKKYGHLDGKINFYQNLRSKEDFVSIHCLNTAILCAMITHVMNIRLEEQLQTVIAAVVHDIGKLRLSKELLFSKEESEENKIKIYYEQLSGLDILENSLRDGIAIKRICAQALKAMHERQTDRQPAFAGKMVTGAKILLVANRYDELTAMNLQGKSESEVKAIQEFAECPEIYDGKVVEALIKSVNILFPGVSVELNTGEKALVLTENPGDILRPTVLTFGDNSVLDLSLPGNSDICIVDMMKTLDNRCVMDMDTLKQVLD